MGKSSVKCCSGLLGNLGKFSSSATLLFLPVVGTHWSRRNTEKERTKRVKKWKPKRQRKDFLISNHSQKGGRPLSRQEAKKAPVPIE